MRNMELVKRVLTETQLRRWRLWRVEGWKHKDIAKKEGCSRPCVTKSIITAEKKLKKIR